MSINILETLKSKVGSSLAENSAVFFSEEKSNTGSAVDGTFAAILAGMIQRVSSDKGAKDLHHELKNETVREYDLADIFARSPQTVNGLVNRGNRFLPTLYPSKLREATNSVAAASNVQKITASKMAKISAPLVLGVLGKHVQDNNLDLNGLKSLLNGQKSAVQSALPASFFEEAEMSSFGWTKKVVVKEEPKPKKVKKEKIKEEKLVKQNNIKQTSTEKMKKHDPIKNVDKAAAGGMGFLKWLLPLLLILAVGFFMMTKGCSGVDTKLPEVKVPEVKVPKVADVMDKAKAVVSNPFGKINDAAMGLLGKIKFASGSAGAQMMAFLKSGKEGEGRFRFKNLNFASGKATIAGTSGAEVDNLSSILKAYEDIKVNVEGFTDSQGNDANNQALSLRRAEAVRARLIKAGISDARITTKGFGEASPVATNDTPEGRAQNRRIEVTIVK